MRPKHPVLWTGVAKLDLKAIIEYIAAGSPRNALEVLHRIEAQAAGLQTLPERGRVVPELQDQGILQYRELIIPPWRLIYRIAEREIYVLSVIDSRQNVEDILLKRMASYSRGQDD